MESQEENRDQKKGARPRAGPGGRSSQREKEQGGAWLCTTCDASSVDRASQKQKVIETETQASTHAIYKLSNELSPHNSLVLCMGKLRQEQISSSPNFTELLNGWIISAPQNLAFLTDSWG